ncbi:MAG: T9SS type A sorting domain-containing protein [Bacteroidetes bacterium]|nr:T9SS type A sorting domain-containing protein [Bacteroidota bacterium]
MKTKLLQASMIAFVAMTINVSAQAPLGPAIITDGFENWTGSNPNNWMAAPANTIATTSVSSVAQVASSSTNTPQSGSYSCKLINSSSSYSTGIMAYAPTTVTASPVAYQISYFARGKGTIACEVTDGSAATSSTHYAAANGQAVNGKGWHHYFQTVIAPTATNNAQFCLKVKSTGTYTSSGGVSIQGIDVDSFVVRPYVPINASLYQIQYTTASNGNSPFFGQYVGKTGGIVTAKVLSSSSTSSAPAYSGYYIQTTGASDWAALLVFDQTNSPNVGDSVTMMGAVDEYFGMTELVQVSNFTAMASGHTISPTLVTSQTVAQESYESFLVGIQAATVNTYSANYGQATMTDASAVPCMLDLKNNFYPPNGTATSGSSGNPGYNVSSYVGTSTDFCVSGNVNYEFNAYNIVPRDSADIVKNCTTLTGIASHSNTLQASMYPNPVANQLMINLPFEAHQVSVSFTDMLGKEVLSVVGLSGHNVSINNMNIPAGVYVIKITADNQTQIAKIVKQ